TSAIREYLATMTAKTATEQYRRALEANDLMIEGQKWPDESMQKAAGIDPTNARAIREYRAPDTPRTSAVRQFLAADAQDNESISDRYRRALEANDTKMEGQKWPDKSMRKAAGIDPSTAAKVRKAWYRATETPEDREPDNA
ncbi:MAG TPA: hypothetical protein VFP68_09765, partial [Burkholderiaceae bacterium]|nr:hypothetical protein [Burkholderiaceae bacterium]